LGGFLPLIPACSGSMISCFAAERFSAFFGQSSFLCFFTPGRNGGMVAASEFGSSFFSSNIFFRPIGGVLFPFRGEDF